jgi:two-component system phosphate regulon response regulator PhoB
MGKPFVPRKVVRCLGGQIIAATWGPDHAVEVRTVDQNIKRLRKHLDGGRGRSMIQTQRGHGYRLNFGPGVAQG